MKNIIESQIEPKDTNVLWLDTSNDIKQLKTFINGKWEVVNDDTKNNEQIVQDVMNQINHNYNNLTDQLKEKINVSQIVNSFSNSNTNINSANFNKEHFVPLFKVKSLDEGNALILFNEIYKYYRSNDNFQPIFFIFKSAYINRIFYTFGEQFFYTVYNGYSSTLTFYQIGDLYNPKRYKITIKKQNNNSAILDLSYTTETFIYSGEENLSVLNATVLKRYRSKIMSSKIRNIFINVNTIEDTYNHIFNTTNGGKIIGFFGNDNAFYLYDFNANVKYHCVISFNNNGDIETFKVERLNLLCNFFTILELNEASTVQNFFNAIGHENTNLGYSTKYYINANFYLFEINYNHVDDTFFGTVTSKETNEKLIIKFTADDADKTLLSCMQYSWDRYSTKFLDVKFEQFASTTDSSVRETILNLIEESMFKIEQEDFTNADVKAVGFNFHFDKFITPNLRFNDIFIIGYFHNKNKNDGEFKWYYNGIIHYKGADNLFSKNHIISCGISFKITSTGISDLQTIDTALYNDINESYDMIQSLNSKLSKLEDRVNALENQLPSS